MNKTKSRVTVRHLSRDIFSLLVEVMPGWNVGSRLQVSVVVNFTWLGKNGPQKDAEQKDKKAGQAFGQKTRQLCVTSMISNLRPQDSSKPRYDGCCEAVSTFPHQKSSSRAPAPWYSVTRVSKKFFTFVRSIVSVIHGKGLRAFPKLAGKPIEVNRRFAI